ncbi:MAG: hypothetical protein NTY48_03135, partial [Candidatus Diapherotrites archaeon]|nr:hypothetical protein [Candidatus Diapherotrites archaeon]
HLLYPKNFPLIIASGVEKEHRPHGETTSRVTYSKKVPLTLESQNVIEKYYLYKSTTFHYFTAFENKHYYKVFQQAERIFEESGIHPNSQMMNVGLRRKGNRPRFVFFEVSWINIPKLHKFIRAMPESNSAQKLRKKQAMELFEFIKKRWAREYKIKWKGYRRKTMEIMTH